MPPRHVAILGGGVSGLTTAFYLSRYLCKSSRITLIEKSHRVGGWIKSFPIPNSRIALEAGPRTFKATGLPISVLQLVHDLNLTDRLVVAPITSAAGHIRYLYLEELGRLALLPSSPLDMLFSSDFRWVLGDLANDFFRGQNRDDAGDESIDSLVSRRFSRDAARMLVSSMVHGIYAADSRKLSATAAFPILPTAEKEGNGSILRGLPKAFELREKRGNFLKPSMMMAGPSDDPEKTQRKLAGSAAFTFDGGLELVPRTLEARLEDTSNVELRKGVACTLLDRGEDGDFHLSLADGTSITATHVVSTLPSSNLYSIIANAKAYGTTPLPILQSGESSSVQVLNLVFPPSPEPLHPPAFGFLIPRPRKDYPVNATTTDEEGSPILQNVLGTVFDSCVDPDHDHKTQPTIMTLMMGGPYPLYERDAETMAGSSPQSSSTMLDSEELPIFLRTLSRFLGRKTPLPHPILNAFHTHLNAIPTPHPGVRDELQEMKAAIREGGWGPNLDVIGMANGVGLGDIITGARLTAANIKIAK